MDCKADADMVNQANENCQPVMMDERSLGFLRFGTSIAHFVLGRCKSQLSGDRVFYHVYNLEGQQISIISVPISWAGTAEVKRGECILLSEKVKSKDHDNGASANEGDDLSYYNTMLIEWEDSPQGDIATRINIMKIHIAEWLRAPLVAKTIVLH